MKPILALAGAFLLSGCLEDEKGPDKALTARVDQLEKDLTKNGIDDFQLWVRVYGLEQRYESSTEFTPAAKGYLPLWTPAGNLLVILRDIRKYANGYKLYFEIGNPTLATFSIPRLTLTWNRAYRGGDFKAWQESARSTHNSLTEDIKPGYWNKVEVIISPATEEETGQLKLTLDANMLSLIKTAPKRGEYQ